MSVVIALALLSTLSGVMTLVCYHCVSQMPLEGIEKAAILAFKQLVFQRYNVPPSLEWCDDASYYQFYESAVQQCDDNDSCVKVSYSQGELSFVMRGCHSLLLRSDYYLSQSIRCNNKGASHCLCKTDLCNSSGFLHYFLNFVIISFVIFF